MPGMCEKKCGECGLCIGYQAQGVIDEKNAEIAKLRAEVEENRLGFKVCKVALGDVAKERDGALLQIGELKKRLIYAVKVVTDEAVRAKGVGATELEGVFLVLAGRINRGPLHDTNDSRHPIDYRKLLLKYMVYLEDLEGVTFVEYMGESEVSFSGEEVSELRSIAKEIRKQS